MGLPRSDDPGSNADGTIATGRASCARQVKGDEPDKKGYIGPPGWGLELEAHNLTSIQKKNLIVVKPNNGCWLDNSGKRPGKVKRMMISILLLGMYSVCIEQEC